MTNYYDYVLAVIPLVFVVGSLSLSLFGVGLPIAIPVAGGMSALFVGHALFIRSPTQITTTPVYTQPTTSPIVVESE